jgi:hypothetical protein
MLLEVIKPGEIVSLRITTGEELVGTLKTEDDKIVELAKPHLLWEEVKQDLVLCHI